MNDRPQLKIRLSDHIADAVRTSADASGRSITAEIERILEAHFAGHDQRAMMREVVAEALADHETKAMDLMRARRAAALDAINLAQPKIRYLGQPEA